MDEERLHPAPVESDLSKLKGVEYSENTGADILQARLGLKFAKKPRKVILTKKNRLMLFVNGVLNPRKNLGLFYSDYYRTGNLFNGAYDRVLKTIFVRESEDNSIVECHENLHAWVKQRNPAFEQATTNTFKARSESRAIPNEDIELAVVLDCIEEGGAEFASIIANLRSENPKERQAALEKDAELVPEYLNGEKVRVEIADKNNPVTAWKELLREVVKIRKETSGISNSFDRYKKLDEADKLLTLIMYSVGYWYFLRKVQILVEEGRTVGASIAHIIDNPPTTIEQLELTEIIKEGSPPGRKLIRGNAFRVDQNPFVPLETRRRLAAGYTKYRR